MGFGVPLDRWFRGPLRPLAHDVLLGSRLRSRGYFRPDAIERLLREHETGQRNWHYQLWNLLVLELWHQTFIDARPAPASAPLAPEVTA
jgi:asparagine synthase (glutamine-hydrolysing)